MELPVDLQWKIFSNSAGEDICRCKGVCTELKEVLSSNKFGHMWCDGGFYTQAATIFYTISTKLRDGTVTREYRKWQPVLKSKSRALDSPFLQVPGVRGKLIPLASNEGMVAVRTQQGDIYIGNPLLKRWRKLSQVIIDPKVRRTMSGLNSIPPECEVRLGRDALAFSGMRLYSYHEGTAVAYQLSLGNSMYHCNNRWYIRTKGEDGQSEHIVPTEYVQGIRVVNETEVEGSDVFESSESDHAYEVIKSDEDHLSNKKQWLGMKGREQSAENYLTGEVTYCGGRASPKGIEFLHGGLHLAAGVLGLPIENKITITGLELIECKGADLVATGTGGWERVGGKFYSVTLLRFEDFFEEAIAKRMGEFTYSPDIVNDMVIWIPDQADLRELKGVVPIFALDLATLEWYGIDQSGCGPDSCVEEVFSWVPNLFWEEDIEVTHFPYSTRKIWEPRSLLRTGKPK